MLTEMTELFHENYRFVIYGSEENQTEVYDFFLGKEGVSDKEWKSILAILRCIGTDPMQYQHRQKFKRLEGKIWEIKLHQIRVACYWQIRGQLLVGIYAFRKKRDDWPVSDLEKARMRYSTCQELDFSRGMLNE